MGSGSDNVFTKYVLPGIQTALGVGSEVVAPGNPAGISAIGSGVGSLAGGAAGGQKGQGLGSSIGGLAGIFGGGGGGSSSIPGVSNSSMTDILESINPGSGIGAADVSGGGLQQGAPGLLSGFGSGLGDFLSKNSSSIGSLLGGLSNKGQQQQQPPQPKEINPAKGPGPQPQLPTPPPTAIGGKVGPESIDPRIMAILARLRR